MFLLSSGSLEVVCKLPNIQKVSLTTNGLVLSRLLTELVEAGLNGLNISLDSLVEQKFEFLTRRKGWTNVWNSVVLAEKLFSPLKLNCVVMRGVNDDELCDFVQLTRMMNLDVRFIEFMPFSGNKWSQRKFFPYSEMLGMIQRVFPELVKLSDTLDSTSKAYKIPGYVGQIGFITSMSKNFCSSCTRLRITADGNLKTCLHGASEVSLRDAIRQGKTEQELCQLISDAVKAKKAAHAGMLNIEAEKNRPMILIGHERPRHGIHFLSLAPKPEKIERRQLHTSVSSLKTFSHLDTSGKAVMVDIGAKPSTNRVAHARSTVVLSPEIIDLISKNLMKKGDVLTVAQIAGIMAAKRTAGLIPLCHNIALSDVKVDHELDSNSTSVHFFSTVQCCAQTGAEMEALTAVAVAALCLYDMCKAISKSIVITDIKLLHKKGGKSDF
ncbi:unnamed protein product [Soboliphyme baturini]|uniref:cyclic pyranopterin monophosphate synthase n=1 Tax=Soboliphyme baturini TaxID=241478 RepID=A0A3P8A9J3_9BILA|nr:unnamed protein product [Soboliphyme baturini]